MAVLVFLSTAACAQSKAEAGCPLRGFTDGQRVSIRGKVGQAPHDMALMVPGCGEAVVLVYAGDPDSGESSDKLLRDASFLRFQKCTRASYWKVDGKGICMQCPMYEVEATLSGRLDVAPDAVPEGQWKDKLGMLHDSSGKLVGRAGFGHPATQRYRLVIELVSDVRARKLPRPRRR